MNYDGERSQRVWGGTIPDWGVQLDGRNPDSRVMVPVDDLRDLLAEIEWMGEELESMGIDLWEVADPIEDQT